MVNTHTEVDVVRSALTKRAFTQIYDHLVKNRTQSATKDFSSKQRQEDRNTQFRQALKMWQLMCKQVKQKIDQERKIVDTLFFGTFARAATIVGD
jgi:hypothetical protein